MVCSLQIVLVLFAKVVSKPSLRFLPQAHELNGLINLIQGSHKIEKKNWLELLNLYFISRIYIYCVLFWYWQHNETVTGFPTQTIWVSCFILDVFFFGQKHHIGCDVQICVRISQITVQTPHSEFCELSAVMETLVQETSATVTLWNVIFPRFKGPVCKILQGYLFTSMFPLVCNHCVFVTAE